MSYLEQMPLAWEGAGIEEHVTMTCPCCDAIDLDTGCLLYTSDAADE